MKNFNWIFGLLFCFTAFGQDPGTFNNSFAFLGTGLYDQGDQNQFATGGIATMRDGVIVLGGNHSGANGTDFAVYRLLPDGSFDNSFNFDGRYPFNMNENDMMRDLVIQPNGKIVFCGSTQDPESKMDMVIHRVNENGFKDNSFGNQGTLQIDQSLGGDEVAERVFVNRIGDIFVSGTMAVGGELFFPLLKLKEDGSPDQTFGNGGKVITKIDFDNALLYDMKVADDGSIYLLGTVIKNNKNRAIVLKVDSNGKLDSSFASDGIKDFTVGIGTEIGAYTIEVDQYNRVYIGGIAQRNNEFDAVLVRLEPNGLTDPTFGNGGFQFYDLTLGAGEVFVEIKRVSIDRILALASTVVGSERSGRLVQLNLNGEKDFSYGEGTGELSLDLTNENEFITKFTASQGLAYTFGNTISGSRGQDFLVTSSYYDDSATTAVRDIRFSPMGIYPNPSLQGQQVLFRLEEPMNGRGELMIYDNLGLLVHQSSVELSHGPLEHTLPTHLLQPGSYHVCLKSDGQQANQILIIQ